MVVGTTIMTTYNNETYRIDDVDEAATPSSEFTKKDGSKMSYTAYYKEVCILNIFYCCNCNNCFLLGKYYN